MNKQRIAVAADHGGYDLKKYLLDNFINNDYRLIDFGCYNKDSVDYPDYAREVAMAIINKQAEFGVLICKTGIGMSIAANKFKDIRAALCFDIDMVELSRKHNNSNILTLGSNYISKNQVCLLVDKFVTTDFDSGRHLLRVKKIKEFEDET